MGLRRQIYQHRKDNRLILGGLSLLLLVLAAVFFFILRSRDLPATLVTNRVLLFVLWYIDVVLILAILFVLLRNLVKLLVERHHRLLGSKFKTKLVATYIGLSLLPALILFFYASNLLQGSIDRWFNTPVKEVLADGSAVAQAFHREIEAARLRDAGRVLREVESAGTREALQRARLGRRLQELQAELGLDMLAVYEGTDLVRGVVNPQTGLGELPEPGKSTLAEAAQRGHAVRMIEPTGTRGRLILAALAGRPTHRVATVVVAGTLLDPVLAAQSERLIQAFQSFRQLEVQKNALKASHFLTFLMVTLLILFFASWTGLYLARRVTVPIQALAAGTRRIADGDLAHRVEAEAGDELGILVDSFNRMTAELERSNREILAANRRLAEERALIAAVLENVAAGVVSLGADGRIFTCNGAALRMLRQEEDDVLGRSAAETWSDAERAKLLAVVARGPAGERASHELRLVLGGEWRTFEVKVTQMRGADGEPAGKVVVIEDLTQLIQAQKLAAWNEAARRIAHEIANPLTPIQLSAERLLHKYRQGDPALGAAVEESAEIISRHVEIMKRMVAEFSRFARMPGPRPVATRLQPLFDDTLRLYRGLKPGVEVSSRVADGAEQAWLDPEQIKRVLINLLDNAIEATEAPGRVEVAADAANGHLAIRVADNGRGIPAAAREKLFLPYFSTKGRGSGLGLAIVHRIIADHHGSIRVEDNAPRGTVFTIELPLG